MTDIKGYHFMCRNIHALFETLDIQNKERKLLQLNGLVQEGSAAFAIFNRIRKVDAVDTFQGVSIRKFYNDGIVIKRFFNRRRIDAPVLIGR